MNFRRNSLFILLLALFAGSAAFCQPPFAGLDFSATDYRALRVEATTIEGLISRLTQKDSTEILKVRAIFRWMTAHIAYDVEGYHNDTLYDEFWWTEGALEKFQHGLYEKRVAQYVFEKRRGICFGYAALFKVLCEHAGLRVAIINGYAKTQTDTIGQPFPSNHAWNMVSIEGKWYLIDVTWASGFCDENVTRFIRKLNEYYFLTPPEQFILNHYPKKIARALLPDPPALEAFFDFPFVRQESRSPSYRQLFPQNGLLECQPGDTITVSFLSPEKIENLTLQGISTENTIVAKSESSVRKAPPLGRQPFEYKYFVKIVLRDEDLEWLDLQANGSDLVRYQVKFVP